jgi:hypothetical protein
MDAFPRVAWFEVDALLRLPRMRFVKYDRPGEHPGLIAVNGLFSVVSMNRRVIGIFLVLLLLGAGAGYAVASATADEPSRASGPEPLPAVSPAVPTVAPIAVLPDPDDPPLPVNVPVVRQVLQNGPRLPGLEVDRPEGWREAHGIRSTEWNWADPERSLNTYKLRINLLKGSHVSVDGAKRSRIAQLESAFDEGNFQSFEVVSEVANTFIATYIDAQGYLRLEMDRFVVLDDTEDAYAVVAVTGREADREGIEDLVGRTAMSMVAVEPTLP